MFAPEMFVIAGVLREAIPNLWEKLASMEELRLAMTG